VHSPLLEFLAVRSIPNVKCALSVNDVPRHHVYVTYSDVTSRLGLSFHLVIEANDCDSKMRYTPHNDFHMSIRSFPHIILEVNPKPNGSDEFHMCLQAACISRIGNRLRALTSDKPIIIMAIYIDKEFKAHQHILCQPDVGSIEVVFN